MTLSNGATSVADTLSARAGIRDQFERLLSVADALTWKPDERAYLDALDQCQVGPADAMFGRGVSLGHRRGAPGGPLRCLGQRGSVG